MYDKVKAKLNHKKIKAKIARVKRNQFSKFGKTSENLRARPHLQLTPATLRQLRNYEQSPVCQRERIYEKKTNNLTKTSNCAKWPLAVRCFWQNRSADFLLSFQEKFSSLVLSNKFCERNSGAILF